MSSKTIKLAAMSLIWNNPKGPDFVPWLDEVVEAEYDGISCFARDLVGYMADPSGLMSELRKRDLSLAGLTGFLSDDAETMKRTMDFMQRTGAEHLAFTDFDTNLDLERGAAILNWAGQVSREFGVKIYYHNHTGGVAGTLTELESLIDMLDLELVHLMLDVGHATKDFVELPYGERAPRFLEKYIDKMSYLEFKDYNEATDLNTPVGEGLTDYERVFSIVKRSNYAGWITVEQNGNRGSSLGRSGLECARASRRFIREHFGV